MSQWHCDADGPRLARERDSCAERFPLTYSIRVIADEEEEEALMNYLYVESMALAEKFDITQGEATGLFLIGVGDSTAQSAAKGGSSRGERPGDG